MDLILRNVDITIHFYHYFAKCFIEEKLSGRKHNIRSYYNKQLKLIFEDLNIDTKIIFYTARHTFATIS